MVTVAAAGILIPLVLVAFGPDYLAPRNLVGAMVPVSVLLAVLGTWPGRGVIGSALMALAVVALLAATITVDLDPRAQRTDWRGIAAAIPGSGPRAVTVNMLGSAPLRYYLPGLRQLPARDSARIAEIVQVGEEPLRASARRPPFAGFVLVGRRALHGVVAYRFRAASPRLISERSLHRHQIALEHSVVLVSPGTISPGNARKAR
jgi:hypothetical protein